MKITVGIAKYEAFELIFGDLLIAIGGVLLGLFYTDQNHLKLIIPIFLFFFTFGIIFDVRAINKFRHDLKEIKKDIDSARTELSKQMESSESIMKELSKAKEKLFGFGSSSDVFAKSSGFHPLDRTVSDLERKVKTMDESIRSLKEQIRGLGRRY